VVSGIYAQNHTRYLRLAAPGAPSLRMRGCG
jgi:hypothetical protein